MRKKLFNWLGNEFVVLSCEGGGGLTGTDETRNIFLRLGEELRAMDLSLENTVRSRLWGKDRESRNIASKERIKILSGKARAVSSSYIAPGHFESDASVAMDLLAMRPPQPGLEKILKEYDPPAFPLRHLTYGRVVFLSGVSSHLPTFAEQVGDVLSHITGSLEDAGVSWDRVVKVSFFLHRNQKVGALRELFRKIVKVAIPQTEYSFVDGYAADGKLIEIEVTAQKTR